VIVQEHADGRLGAEMAAIVAERAMLDLRAPVERVTGYDVAFPYWRLEDVYLPSAERVADAVRRNAGVLKCSMSSGCRISAKEWPRAKSPSG